MAYWRMLLQQSQWPSWLCNPLHQNDKDISYPHQHHSQSPSSTSSSVTAIGNSFVFLHRPWPYEPLRSSEIGTTGSRAALAGVSGTFRGTTQLWTKVCSTSETMVLVMSQSKTSQIIGGKHHWVASRQQKNSKWLKEKLSSVPCARPARPLVISTSAKSGLWDPNTLRLRSWGRPVIRLSSTIKGAESFLIEGLENS